jgi:hypothetical protein
MTLELLRNSRSEVVPCLPCCNTGYQNCACATNENLNTLGGKNANGQDLDKKNPGNLVTFFISDLFVGESWVANKNERTDGIYQDGMSASGVTCLDKVWSFTFPTTPQTLQAYVRFLSGIFEGRLVIDGVDSGWVELDKTFGSEYLTTLEGEISGYKIITHSFCICRGDSTSPGNSYPPNMKETQIGIKPFYVNIADLPAVCGSSFEINKASLVEPYPLRNAADLAIHHENYPITGSATVQAGPDWYLNYVFTFGSQSLTVVCSGLILSIPFSWGVDAYTQAVGDYTDQSNWGNKEAATFVAKTPTAYGGNPPGTTHWMNGSNWHLYQGIPNGNGRTPDVYLLPYPDFSYPIKIDFEPFYYEYTAYGFNRTKDDFNLGTKYNHTLYDGEIFSPKVIITE